jgi:hypothetical protein
VELGCENATPLPLFWLSLFFNFNLVTPAYGVTLKINWFSFPWNLSAVPLKFLWPTSLWKPMLKLFKWIAFISLGKKRISILRLVLVENNANYCFYLWLTKVLVQQVLLRTPVTVPLWSPTEVTNRLPDSAFPLLSSGWRSQCFATHSRSWSRPRSCCGSLLKMSSTGAWPLRNRVFSQILTVDFLTPSNTHTLESS